MLSSGCRLMDMDVDELQEHQLSTLQVRRPGWLAWPSTASFVCAALQPRCRRWSIKYHLSGSSALPVPTAPRRCWWRRPPTAWGPCWRCAPPAAPPSWSQPRCTRTRDRCSERAPALLLCRRPANALPCHHGPRLPCMNLCRCPVPAGQQPTWCWVSRWSSLLPRCWASTQVTQEGGGQPCMTHSRSALAAQCSVRTAPIMNPAAGAAAVALPGCARACGASQ